MTGTVMPLTIGSLFSGAGWLDQAVEQATDPVPANYRIETPA